MPLVWDLELLDMRREEEERQQECFLLSPPVYVPSHLKQEMRREEKERKNCKWHLHFGSLQPQELI